MKDQNEKKLSAQVIVKPASGRDSSSTEKITSENVDQIMPSAEDFQKAKNYFKKLGFEVDAGFANSFSITGDQRLFEKAFEEKLSPDENQAIKTSGANSELKIKHLSAEIKKIVETVTFSEPPDFGPGNF